MRVYRSRRHFLGTGAGAVAAAGLATLSGSSVSLAAAATGSAPLADIDPNTIRRRGTGLRGFDPNRASPGSTLYTPQNGDGTVYLIDLDGTVTHTWQMPYPPGRYAYLSERGTLFYTGRTAGSTHSWVPSGKGGVALEADWNSRVLWEVQHPDHRNDARLLRNGNVLLICAGVVPEDIAARVVGGIPGTDDSGTMHADFLVEMTPSGQIVWEWRTWEHLSPEADGHTAPGDARDDWTGANALIELPDGDVLLSMRQISTIVRIDRQTGEITWRLGAPPLSGQHAPTLLPNGNVLLLDNGPFRLDQAVAGGTPFPFSRVLELDPATNEIVWQYREPVPQFFFSPGLGNAQRLPNGNTLVNEGYFGRFFEVTPAGEVVWEYVNPIFGPASAPPGAQQNLVFRAYRYTAEEIAMARVNS